MNTPPDDEPPYTKEELIEQAESDTEYPPTVRQPEAPPQRVGIWTCAVTLAIFILIVVALYLIGRFLF